MNLSHSALRIPVVLARAAAPWPGVAARYDVVDGRIQADLRRFLRMHEAEADVPLLDLLFLDVRFTVPRDGEEGADECSRGDVLNTTVWV